MACWCPILSVHIFSRFLRDSPHVVVHLFLVMFLFVCLFFVMAVVHSITQKHSQSFAVCLFLNFSLKKRKKTKKNNLPASVSFVFFIRDLFSMPTLATRWICRKQKITKNEDKWVNRRPTYFAHTIHIKQGGGWLDELVIFVGVSKLLYGNV